LRDQNFDYASGRRNTWPRFERAAAGQRFRVKRPRRLDYSERSGEIDFLHQFELAAHVQPIEWSASHLIVMANVLIEFVNVVEILADAMQCFGGIDVDIAVGRRPRVENGLFP